MKKTTGLKHLIEAGRYTFMGLKATYQTEAAFRQELLATVCLFPLAFIMATSSLHFSLLVGSLLLILLVELLNTALEAVVDRISSAQHPLSKKAKDAGSAAVFVALMMALLLWGSAIWTHWIG